MRGPVLKEAGVLVALSLALAVAYNGTTQKGIFGSTEQANRLTPSSAATTAPEIIPVEVAKSLFDSKAALFIDSRHAFDFRLGHISGAINIPLQDADNTIAGLSAPKNKELVVYCDGADCNSSLEIGSKLAIAGYSRVKIFFGGWEAWKNAGLPVEETKP